MGFAGHFGWDLAVKLNGIARSFSVGLSTWTKLDIATMAKQTSLDEFYYLAYFLPTMHSHATSMSIDQRLKHYENDSIGFDEMSQSEIADKALIISHHLIIRLIEIQNSYFNWVF